MVFSLSVLLSFTANYLPYSLNKMYFHTDNINAAKKRTKGKQLRIAKLRCGTFTPLNFATRKLYRIGTSALRIRLDDF